MYIIYVYNPRYKIKYKYQRDKTKFKTFKTYAATRAYRDA
jgi:hypothetical protein